MAREMSYGEIEALLSEHYVARIGSHASDETYVVPVAYVWDETAILAFSYEGRKLVMMRSEPKVCVEIDDVVDLGRWRSVIAWGVFEELDGEMRSRAMEVLARGLAPRILDDESRRRLDRAMADDPPPVVFRIILEKRTGRLEGKWRIEN